MANGLPELKTDFSPQPIDLSKILMTAATLKHADTQNTLANMQLQQQLQTKDALAGLGSSGANVGTGDYQNTANKLLQIGNTEGAKTVAGIGQLYNKADPEAKLKNIQAEKEFLKTATDSIPFLKSNPSAYPDFVTWAKSKGANPALFPDPATFKNPDGSMNTEAYNAYLDKAQTNAVDYGKRLEMQLQSTTTHAGQVIKQADGSSLYIPPQLAHQSQGITSPGSVIIPKGSIANRNNNPGNLMFVGQNGATQGEPKEGGGYWAKFDSPESGWNALQNQIETDKARGLTLGGFISKYAPSSENNTAAYIASVAKSIGATENTPLSKIDTGILAKQIGAYESSSSLASAAVPTAVPAGLPAGTVVIPGEKPKPKPSFEQQTAIDAFTAKNGREPTSQEIPNVLSESKNMAVGVVPNPTPGLTGEDALQNYTSQVQTLARKLVAAEIPYPSSFAVKDPLWKTVIQAASDLDPGFNAAQYDVRKKTRSSFTSGQDSKNITSINTLIGHLDSLNSAAQDLGNTWSPTFNYVGNMLQTGTGNPKVTKFNMALGAVESELATVFKGTGGTDQEIKAWRERVTASQSPQQLQAAITQAVDLMDSRLSALKNKYTSGMGPFNTMDILSPKSRSILDKLIPGAASQLEPNSKQNNGSSGDASTMSDDELKKALGL